MRSIEDILNLSSARLLAVHPHGNLTGLLSLLAIKTNEEVSRLIDGGEIDTLYLVCDNPFEARPAVKSIICQDIFPPPFSLPGDLILPVTTFGEISGSYYTDRGIRKKFANHIRPAETVRHQQWIFSRIAKAMGAGAARFSAQGLERLIPDQAKVGMPVRIAPRATAKEKACAAAGKSGFILVQVRAAHRYHHTT